MENPANGFNIGALNSPLKDARKGGNFISFALKNSSHIHPQEIALEKSPFTPVGFNHYNEFYNLLKAPENIWRLFFFINNRVN